MARLMGVVGAIVGGFVLGMLTHPATANEHARVDVLICEQQCSAVTLRIWDGDTFRVGLTSEAEAVRIMNIDTAEIEGKCHFESELAQQAKLRLVHLLEGQQVVLLRQGVDKYGRTLATVQVSGRDVGDQLVAEGLARTWSGRREPWC